MIHRTSKAGAAQLRRLAKAMWIARKGGMVQANGAWVVTSDTGHTYAINGACQCADYRRGAARNGGWCKHRLAVWLVTELAKGEKLPALYAGAVQRIVKKHPADATNTDGAVKTSKNIEGSATETIFQARIDWLESEVLAMRKTLGDLLDRYEGDLEARRAFAPR